MKFNFLSSFLNKLSAALLIASFAVGFWLAVQPAQAGTTQKHYYAHDAVEDKHGVIAPWCTGLNGQSDFRIRIAAETLKRYPWTDTTKAVAAAPEYMFNGHWQISPDGKISVRPLSDWSNGDLGQRAAYVLSSLVDYYRYSGDPAAIAHITYQADLLLAHCQTGPDHPWPNFLISVPTKGKVYGKCDPKGFIQLDIVAEVGIGLLRSYQLTGNKRWLEAAKHWADLLAEKRSRKAGAPPWERYANPEDVRWKDNEQTGGVVFVLYFLDEVIRLGYMGKDNSIVEARDAGRAYLRDTLLPAWTVNDTWGRNYWDWPNPVQTLNVSQFAAQYLMDNKDDFPNWRNDARNILSLFFNRTSVSPKSRGDVYSGAWAFPESSSCCGRSLWYAPLHLAMPFAQYDAEADSEWGREIARRMHILANYDSHETGVSEDNIDGGFIVCGGWFKIAHPGALKAVLGTLAWLPELGANRENHIMRSAGVVTSVIYGKGKIAYSTFDAPINSVDVLRLAFRPGSVRADGEPLSPRPDLNNNGYIVKMVSNGDCIVSIRRDGCTSVVVEGNDPQEAADDANLGYQGNWKVSPNDKDFGDGCHFADAKGAKMFFSFTGNQVRLLGRAATDGGLADVYVDGVEQLVGIDCWNPSVRHQQVLYYKNGLDNGDHVLEIVAHGTKNPRSNGANVYVDAVQWSNARGAIGYGEGGGPTIAQRMIFGYTGREDYTDSEGNKWRPGTEFVARSRKGADSVAKAWWTDPGTDPIANTDDPDLYRYGVHAKELIVNVTVGPGEYHARLKFAATRKMDARRNCVTVMINGQQVVRKMDVAATAGGPDRAVDLVFNNITPRNGIIEIRFIGGDEASRVVGEAFVQAIEVGPEDDGEGAVAVSIAENRLANPGFEGGVPHFEGTAGTHKADIGWTITFAGPSKSYVSSESSVEDPNVCSGKEALRIRSDGNSKTIVFQDVLVNPSAQYRASAFVITHDPDGKGFGHSREDSAGVRVQELDADGDIVANHPKAGVTKARPYTYVFINLTTTPRTAKVRFMLDVEIGPNSTNASVTYDDCALDGPPIPCSITGRVAHKGNNLPGAVVTAADKTATSDANGVYIIEGVPATRRAIRLRAAKKGYYSQEKWVSPSSLVNELDFELIGPPANNLLVNPGFEEGVQAEYRGTGKAGSYGWSYAAGHTASGKSLIYPESVYDEKGLQFLGRSRFHSGKQAIRVYTFGKGHIKVYQDVAVAPNASYTASAFLMARDLDGHGFGSDPNDSAGIHIQELDSKGNVVADHQKVGVKKATDYTYTSTTFTTTAKTTHVRFILDTVIACSWRRGSITYDDCALDGPAPPSAASDKQPEALPRKENR